VQEEWWEKVGESRHIVSASHLPLDALSVGAARLLLYHFLNVAGVG
jgi:hypothetical protein